MAVLDHRSVGRIPFVAFILPLLIAPIGALRAEPPPSTPPTVVATATAVPLGEVAPLADETMSRVRDIDAATTSDDIGRTIGGDLPLLSKEIDARLRETSRILSGALSLDSLKDLEASWQTTAADLGAWSRALLRKISQLTEERGRLDGLRTSWNQTLASSSQADAPMETVGRVKSTLAAVSAILDRIDKQNADLLKLQSRVGEQAGRVDEALRSIGKAREETVSRLLVRDSQPIWSIDDRSRPADKLAEDTQASFAVQRTALAAYAEREGERFALHAILFCLGFGAMAWVRRRIGRRAADDPTLAEATAVFRTPMSMALIITFLVSGWIYPQSPRLLRAILGAVALIPTVFILRKVVERRFHAALYVLVLFYLADQVRLVVSSLSFVSRAFFLGEAATAVVLIEWLIRRERRSDVAPRVRGLSGSTFIAALRVASAVLSAAVVLNCFGYVGLSMLLGNGVFSSAYLAVILHAGLRSVNGLTTFALRVPPFSMLRAVSRNTDLLQRRLRAATLWVAVLLWVRYTLESFSIQGGDLRSYFAILDSPIGYGTATFSPGNLVALGLTIWGAFLTSRFVRFVLDEEIYPRAGLSRGLPYAISRVTHYSILVLGYFLGAAALGVDMTKFTVIAGAIGVGLGFGLQNIINNFFSGLIVLFERPVRVGDVIQIADIEGIVERIGIRASFVRTAHGSEVIIPNAQFISERVVNWTFANRQRAIQIPLSVPAAVEPRKVMELLRRVAASNEQVSKDPAPEVVATKFGADSISFELRAFTSRFSDWSQIRSDLAVALHDALQAESIPLR